MAEALAEHQGIGRLNTVDHSAEIDVDDLIPSLDGVIAKLATGGDARVVEDEVEPFVLPGYPLNQTPHALKVRNVEGARRGRPSGSTRDARSCFIPPWLQVSENNGRPSLGKLLRECAADTRSSTGDDRHGTVKYAKTCRSH